MRRDNVGGSLRSNLILIGLFMLRRIIGRRVFGRFKDR
jgi:hypothetical protein